MKCTDVVPGRNLVPGTYFVLTKQLSCCDCHCCSGPKVFPAGWSILGHSGAGGWFRGYLEARLGLSSVSIAFAFLSNFLSLPCVPVALGFPIPNCETVSVTRYFTIPKAALVFPGLSKMPSQFIS